MNAGSQDSSYKRGSQNMDSNSDFWSAEKQVDTLIQDEEMKWSMLEEDRIK